MSARFKIMRVCVCVLFVCFSASEALAEKPIRKLTVDDQAPKGVQAEPAPAFQYSSVFDDYVPFDDVPDIGWKEANDNVGQIGGWRAYAKLVQEEAKKKAELEAKESGGDQQ